VTCNSGKSFRISSPYEPWSEQEVRYSACAESTIASPETGSFEEFVATIGVNNTFCVIEKFKDAAGVDKLRKTRFRSLSKLRRGANEGDGKASLRTYVWKIVQDGEAVVA
jgi:hypothetical protein